MNQSLAEMAQLMLTSFDLDSSGALDKSELQVALANLREMMMQQQQQAVQQAVQQATMANQAISSQLGSNSTDGMSNMGRGRGVYISQNAMDAQGQRFSGGGGSGGGPAGGGHGGGGSRH